MARCSWVTTSPSMVAVRTLGCWIPPRPAYSTPQRWRQWRYRAAIMNGAPSAVSRVVSAPRFELGVADRFRDY